MVLRAQKSPSLGSKITHTGVKNHPHWGQKAPTLGSKSTLTGIKNHPHWGQKSPTLGSKSTLTGIKGRKWLDSSCFFVRENMRRCSVSRYAWGLYNNHIYRASGPVHTFFFLSASNFVKFHSLHTSCEYAKPILLSHGCFCSECF